MTTEYILCYILEDTGSRYCINKRTVSCRFPPADEAMKCTLFLDYSTHFSDAKSQTTINRKQKPVNKTHSFQWDFHTWSYLWNRKIKHKALYVFIQCHLVSHWSTLLNPKITQYFYKNLCPLALCHAKFFSYWKSGKKAMQSLFTIPTFSLQYVTVHIGMCLWMSKRNIILTNIVYIL